MSKAKPSSKRIAQLWESCLQCAKHWSETKAQPQRHAQSRSKMQEYFAKFHAEHGPTRLFVDVCVPGASRKRKGRSKPLTRKDMLPLPKQRTVSSGQLRYEDMMREAAQRGPTAPPSYFGQLLGKAGAKPWRPFADQQPRILSQMEREDWRPKPPKLDPKTAEYLRMIAQGQAEAPPAAYSGSLYRGILGEFLGSGLG